MSNPTQQPKMSQRKQVRSALERIDTMEGDVQRLFEAVNQVSMQGNQRTTELAAITEAVVELFGAEVVDAKIKEIADRKTLLALERAKEAVKAGLEKGELVKADVIGEKSLIIGREIDEKGEVVFPGQVQLQMSAVKPEFQEKLTGKGAGTVIEAPRGKFEVLEVFDVVAKAPEAATDDPNIDPKFLEEQAKLAAQMAAAPPAPTETVDQLEKALDPTTPAQA